MDSYEDIEDDAEDLTVGEVLFLSIVNYCPAKITRIQKLSLFAERILDLGPELTHFAYDYGGFSKQVDQAKSSLEGDGAVWMNNDDYELTPYGAALLAEVSTDPKYKAFIEDLPRIIAFLESLSDWNLKHLSYIVYPETAEKSTIKHQMDMNASTVGDFKVTKDLSREQIEKLLIQRHSSVKFLDRLMNHRSVIVLDGDGAALLVTLCDGHYITSERITRL